MSNIPCLIFFQVLVLHKLGRTYTCWTVKMLKQLATVQDLGRNRQWERERQREREREGRLNEITSNRKGLEGSLRPLLCMKASMSHPCVPLTARLPRTPHSHALLTVSWKQAERESPILPHHEGREVEGRGNSRGGWGDDEGDSTRLR